MKPRLSSALMIAGLVLAAAGSVPAALELSAPPPPRIAPPEEREGRGSNPSRLGPRTSGHLKIPASELPAEEKVAFEKEFVEKLKPAVERWCKTYEGHLPFRPEDVTPDKFRERFGDSPAFYDYGFVIDGTTLSVVDYHGDVYVAYLMSPAAALLFQMPKNPEPPKPVSVSREEVLRLLKADSGRDFPPEQIGMWPTAYEGAMNGGLEVEVGEGVHQKYGPLPRHSMVFGPDGNLACYLRWMTKPQ